MSRPLRTYISLDDDKLSASSRADFRCVLREVKTVSGFSVRQIAAKINASSSLVQKMTSRSTAGLVDYLPRRSMVEAFLMACHVDPRQRLHICKIHQELSRR